MQTQNAEGGHARVRLEAEAEEEEWRGSDRRNDNPCVNSSPPIPRRRRATLSARPRFPGEVHSFNRCVLEVETTCLFGSVVLILGKVSIPLTSRISSADDAQSLVLGLPGSSSSASDDATAAVQTRPSLASPAMAQPHHRPRAPPAARPLMLREAGIKCKYWTPEPPATLSPQRSVGTTQRASPSAPRTPSRSRSSPLAHRSIARQSDRQVFTDRCCVVLLVFEVPEKVTAGIPRPHMTNGEVPFAFHSYLDSHFPSTCTHDLAMTAEIASLRFPTRTHPSHRARWLLIRTPWALYEKPAGSVSDTVPYKADFHPEDNSVVMTEIGHFTKRRTVTVDDTAYPVWKRK